MLNLYKFRKYSKYSQAFKQFTLYKMKYSYYNYLNFLAITVFFGYLQWFIVEINTNSLSFMYNISVQLN